jgi:hypothetical protein
MNEQLFPVLQKEEGGGEKVKGAAIAIEPRNRGW